MRIIIPVLAAFLLTGCGAVYYSPSVSANSTESSKVRVISITPETTLLANRSKYQPQTLPAIFSQTAGGSSGLRGSGALPEPAFQSERRPAALETRIPPKSDPGPYKIGVGDVLILATPQTGNTVEELSGLLAAQNRRQGYTVQDDGTISIPDIGRIRLVNLTMEDAEAELFQRLVENKFDPAFSIEISEFNARKVSIGGAVKRPSITPITLTPLYLDQALSLAGGATVTDPDYATVRLYRNGTLYQIPLEKLYVRNGLPRIRLLDGDSVFVDAEYELDKAEAYFEEQIRLAEFRQGARQAALSNLSTEVSLRRATLQEARENYQSHIDLGAVKRDYVYLTGEVSKQSRYALPFNQIATLADALYDQAGGIPTETANVREIYVLRGSDDPREFASITAWQLDGRNATNFLLATRFELRPNDVIFVSEQPITRWGRVVRQITPSLITTPYTSATN